MGDMNRQDSSSLPAVFLCGPITGVSLEHAMSWRLKVSRALAGHVRVIDPTRHGVESRRWSADASGQSLTVDRLLHGKSTVARDRFDVERADLIFACFLGATSISIGSVGEIFWANAFTKPVIVVRESHNPHNHDMLNELAGWIFEDLDSAIAQIRSIFDIHPQH